MASSKEQLVGQIKAIVRQDNAVMGPLAKYNGIKTLLLEAKVGYYAELHVGTILVHPSNRGKTGLSHHNAHKNGLKIYNVGADLDLLKQACCQEMHPAGSSKHEEQVLGNKKLVDASNRMLAPVTGEERFVSLGTGHTTAFCRAANAGCPTPYKDIRDSNGNLNAAMLKASNQNLSKMLTDGWTWFVVPWWLEDEVPEWPHLAQKALNVHHSVVSSANEVEVAASIAQEISYQGDKVSWSDAIAATAASEPPCKDYIDTVGKYVKTFGGGDNAPIISFLAGFGREYGVTLKLGEEFLVCLTELQMPGELRIYICMRAAFIATQLTSSGPKCKDGYGKLLTVADINALKSKENKSKVDEAEDVLLAAWKATRLMVSAGEIDEAKGYGLFGRLCMRIVLLITHKRKWGLDTTEYPSVAAIKAKYEAEATKLKAGAGTNDAGAIVPKPNECNTEAPAQIDDASNPLWLAQLKCPMKVGSHYQCSKDHPGALFKLTSMTTTGLIFKEHNALDAGLGSTVMCPLLLDKMKQWKIYTGKIHIAAPPAVSSLFVSKSAGVSNDDARCKLWTALSLLSKAYDLAKGDLVFTCNPNAVYAGRPFKKGELKLYPMTDSINKVSVAVATANPSKCAKVLVDNTISLVIVPPASINSLIEDWDISKLSKLTTIVVPYWWVAGVSEAGQGESKINMKLQSDGCGEVSVQSLTNCRAIKLHEQLMFIDPTKAQLKKSSK